MLYQNISLSSYAIWRCCCRSHYFLFQLEEIQREGERHRKDLNIEHNAKVSIMLIIH